MNSLSGAKRAPDPRFWLCSGCQRELTKQRRLHGSISPKDVHRAATEGMTKDDSPSVRKQRQKLDNKAKRRADDGIARTTVRREGFLGAVKLFVTTRIAPPPPVECEACKKAQAEKFGPLYILTA